MSETDQIQSPAVDSETKSEAPEQIPVLPDKTPAVSEETSSSPPTDIISSTGQSAEQISAAPTALQPQSNQTQSAPQDAAPSSAAQSPIQSLAPTPTELARTDPRSLLSKALEKIQFRKRAKLDKIMKLALTKRSITNDDVQKLLRVSDATATRYLSYLVKQGRLRRTGTTTAIRYEPIIGSNGGN